MRESFGTARTIAPQIAVVGSGPSGCYTAQFLTKADPSVRVTVFDRLPVPFGLVRYGVAADHQGTKSVVRQFEKLFESPRVRFAGNITLGRDLSVDDLLESFDAVVVATGLHVDMPLELKGAGLQGVLGAGAVTRFLNGHPDVDAPPPCGQDAVVIGAGNVAVDVVRLLAKAPEHYEGSDMDDSAHRRLTSELRSITLIARSGAENAKFDRAAVRELGEILGIRIEVHGIDPDASDPKSETVRALASAGASPARVRLVLRFRTSPVEIVGATRVEGLRVHDATGEHVIPAQTIITAVGFTGHSATASDPRVRTVGWARRGPVGTIPDNRNDARQVADQVLSSLAGRGSMALPGFDGLPFEVRQRAKGIEHWNRIDAVEVASAEPGRTRRKLRTWDALLGHPTHDEPALVLTSSHDDEGNGR
ncbi:FAD-dependent oxidoreductase [Microbacterium sp. NPDC078428]|uniref:FAD-dependent oxidoreductase n=1 Tax=Microbacterium sp. NPDC078428 TaxID=3364190 RepID=UPI0037C5EC7F